MKSDTYVPSTTAVSFETFVDSLYVWICERDNAKNLGDYVYPSDARMLMKCAQLVKRVIEKENDNL